MRLPTLTLGIEEEYQIIDPETRELAQGSSTLIERGQEILQDQIKPELMQSQVEVGTVPCRSIAEACDEIVRLRSAIHGLARGAGLRADRQLATHRETGDLTAVVDRLIAESEEGCLE